MKRKIIAMVHSRPTGSSWRCGPEIVLLSMAVNGWGINWSNRALECRDMIKFSAHR